MNMFQLKAIAILAMLVDHFALLFFPQSLLFQIIGRMSFPLIAWLIANGARHTKNIDHYLLRLFGFATLSQIPYEVGFHLANRPAFALLNVLFTLFLGLLAIRFLQKSSSTVMKVSASAACVIAAQLLNCDYGAAGVLSIVAFYLFFENISLMVLSQAIILWITPLCISYLAMHGTYLSRYYLWYPSEGWGLLALPLIYLYNGARGPKYQYFFYWFFPLQSLAVLALKMFVR